MWKAKKEREDTLEKMREEIRLVDDNRRWGFYMSEVAAKCNDHMVQDLREKLNTTGPAPKSVNDGKISTKMWNFIYVVIRIL